ncbi:MAG: hypothetical protein B6U85_02905 [Desulfurococcales archaeon ex4484_42]|nr:MAG: hypothetical protein B6U85_02905 [Desulfurococcales archaeon ex4484_42]
MSTSDRLKKYAVILLHTEIILGRSYHYDLRGWELMTEMNWRCDCPICRLIVYPIIRRISSASKVVSKEESKEFKTSKSIEELTKGRPAEIVKLSDIEQQEIPQGQSVATVASAGTESIEQQASLQPIAFPTTDLQSQRTETQQEQQYQEQSSSMEDKERGESNVNVPKDLYERLDSLESEIDKIKKYVKASIDGIKATLVDLRSAMAELSNPFNILRKYADILLTPEGKSEKEGSNVKEQQYIQPQIVPIVVPLAQGTTIQSGQLQQQGRENVEVKPKEEGESARTKGESLKEEIDEETREKININPDVYERLVLWINSLLNKIPLEGINKLIDNYVLTGIIDKDMGRTLKTMAKTINELKSIGLDIKEQAKYLRELLKALNITSKDIKEFTTQLEKSEEKTSGVGNNEESNQVEELLKMINEDEGNEQ